MSDLGRALPAQSIAAMFGPPEPPSGVAYFDKARTLLGKNEGLDRGVIQEYLRNGGVNLDPATTAWCAAFINASLQQEGYEGTGSNMARSFATYGEAVDKPQRGDLAVFSREGQPNSPLGHVGFFDGYDENGKIRVLGGNQSDSVRLSSYAPDRLLAFRRPIKGGGPSMNAKNPSGPTPAGTPLPSAPAPSSLASTPPLSVPEGTSLASFFTATPAQQPRVDTQARAKADRLRREALYADPFA